jgi:hypothetical protein
MPLWVEVDHQRIRAAPRQQARKVQGGRRLADPALLIEYRNACHRDLRLAVTAMDWTGDFAL